MPSRSDRLKAINHELDRYEQKPDGSRAAGLSIKPNNTLKLGNTSGIKNNKTGLSMKSRKGPALSMERKPQASLAEESKRAPEQKQNNNFSNSYSRDLELAFQMSFYNYKTDGGWPYYYSLVHPIANDVQKDARLMGLYGSYTWHFFQRGPILAFKDLFRNAPTMDFTRLEIDSSWGKINYDSYATGKLKDSSAWKLNLRLLFGLELANKDYSFVVKPYLGLGYRRFTDKAGGWEDYFVSNYAQFSTKHSYYYIPIGLDTLMRVNDNVDFVFRLEADPIVTGSVQYYYSEIPGSFSGFFDLATGEPLVLSPRNAASDIKGGYGLKTSFKLIKKFDEFNIFTEPFLEFWRVKKTDPEQAHAQATNGKSYVSAFPDGSPYKPIFEPLNYTLDCGVRMGFQF